jgi:hypothetical protein
VIKFWLQYTAIFNEMRHNLETRSDFQNFKVMAPVPEILLLAEWINNHHRMSA